MSVSGQLHLLGPWIGEICHLIERIKLNTCVCTGRHLRGWINQGNKEEWMKPVDLMVVLEFILELLVSLDKVRLTCECVEETGDNYNRG